MDKLDRVHDADAGTAFVPAGLPIAATGGSGALRGLTGTGTTTKLGRIDAGAASAATVTFWHASPGQTYTLTTREEGTDALDGALAPLGQSRPVTAPLLP